MSKPGKAAMAGLPVLAWAVVLWPRIRPVLWRGFTD